MYALLHSVTVNTWCELPAVTLVLGYPHAAAGAYGT